MSDFDYFIQRNATQKINERVELTRRSRPPQRRRPWSRHRPQPVRPD